jgi:Bax protein
MNTHSPGLNKSDNNKRCKHSILFGKHHMPHWAVYLSLGIITAVLVFVISTLGTSFQLADQPAAPAAQHLEPAVFASEKHEATDYLINKLKEYRLWKIHPSREVPRFFIESYPDDINAVEDIAIKKKVFLHSLLPHALFVRQEVLHKRERLKLILGKIDCPLEDINFAAGLEPENQCSWPGFLVEDEVRFIQKLCRNYRNTTANGLLERVDAVPTSIILAQGALESSWGGSRFAQEGNSVFGMWTWKNKGIVPLRREEGKTHKVNVYENILDSVRAYHLTLNRLDPYDQFRRLRRHTDNPLIMADGLTFYSERGEAYVEEIKNIIISNDLQKYDSCRLSDLTLPEFSSSIARQPAKVSL